MDRRVLSLPRTLALLLLVAGSPSAHADNIHFNTDTGVMTIDGGDTTSFFGVPVQTSVVYLTPTFQPGDFDHDGAVDGNDFLKWQRGESPAPTSASDLAHWRADFGSKMLTPNSQPVPEPTTLTILLLAAAIFAGSGGRSSR